MVQMMTWQTADPDLPAQLGDDSERHEAGEEEDGADDDGGGVGVDAAPDLLEDRAAVENHHVETGHLEEEHHEERDDERLEDLRLQKHRDGLAFPLPDPQFLLDHLNFPVQGLGPSGEMEMVNREKKKC